MAQRLWTPFDMVGLGGISMMRGRTNVSAVTPGTAGSPVNTVTAQRQSGTADAAQSFRDDFRPVLGSVNGLQVVTFDTATRQLQIATPGNLPSGTGSKGWCFAGFIRETRTDDRYVWGYGGGNQTGVAYKLRQGAVPYSDVGSTGYAIGSIPVAASGLTVIVEAYNGATSTSRANLNGNSTFTEYAKARNTSATNARLGSWPLYGNGSAHDFGYLIWWTSGDASTDDLLRLAAFCSWDAGEAGAGLHASNPWKNAAPTIDDGTGGATATGAVSLAGITSAAAGVTTLTASAVPILAPISVAGLGGVASSGVGVLTLMPLTMAGAAGAGASAMLAVALSPIGIAGAAGSYVAAAGAPALSFVLGSGSGSSVPIVFAGGVVSLGAVAAIGAGGIAATGGGGSPLAIATGSGVCGVAPRGAAATTLDPIGVTGTAGAATIGLSTVQIAPALLVARAVSTTASSGGATLLTIAGTGSAINVGPVTAPVFIPIGNRFVIPARQRAFVIPARQRAFLIRKGASMSPIRKYQAEVRSYQADWSPDLAGQAIAGEIAAESNDPALIVDRVTYSGAIMRFRLRGGTPGEVSTLTFTAPTLEGDALVWAQTVSVPLIG